MLKAGFRTGRSALLFYVAMAVFVFLTLFPMLWVFKMSIISESELISTPPKLLPQNVTLENYRLAFTSSRFQFGMGNSFLIAFLTTVICLTVGSIAAYALARIDFVLRAPILSLILAIAFFPAVAILAPLFLQWDRFGLTDTYQAVIIPDILIASPLTVFLLVAYFRELPADLEEAAKVDGATTWQAFWKVTVPLSIPGVVTTGILTFIFAWNEFLFANTFLFSPETQPATVALPNFVAGQFRVQYGAQAAAAIAMTVPLVLLVLIFQRRIVSGLTAGATKG